jgi:hypothetical protein
VTTEQARMQASSEARLCPGSALGEAADEREEQGGGRDDRDH